MSDAVLWKKTFSSHWFSSFSQSTPPSNTINTTINTTFNTINITITTTITTIITVTTITTITTNLIINIKNVNNNSNTNKINARNAAIMNLFMKQRPPLSLFILRSVLPLAVLHTTGFVAKDDSPHPRMGTGDGKGDYGYENWVIRVAATAAATAAAYNAGGGV